MGSYTLGEESLHGGILMKRIVFFVAALLSVAASAFAQDQLGDAYKEAGLSRAGGSLTLSDVDKKDFTEILTCDRGKTKVSEHVPVAGTTGIPWRILRVINAKTSTKYFHLTVGRENFFFVQKPHQSEPELTDEDAWFWADHGWERVNFSGLIDAATQYFRHEQYGPSSSDCIASPKK